MYTGLLHAHSGLRYVVLVLLVAVLAKSLLGWLGGKPFGKLDDRFSLFFFISIHTMLVLGLVLYFISPRVIFSASTMSDPVARYWTVEHITANIIAVVAFSLGRIRSKKQTTDAGKHRILFLFTAVGFVILVASLTGSVAAPGLFGSR